MAFARFDDLRSAGEPSLRMVGPLDEIVARAPDEVAPCLERLDGATARGRWAAGFVAYEAAPGLDRSLAVLPRPPGDAFADLPLMWFGIFEGAEPDPLGEAEPSPAPGPWLSATDRDAYDAAVARIREHIAAGDTYQVNHTLRLRTAFGGDDMALYRDLCLAQRGAHCAYLDLGRYRVLSASPELFFRIDGDRITTRPMKGTARRGRWPEEDLTAAARLLASAKDRAENAMIVDLLRNDLGRISEAGTVRVERLFEPERYETVWQLTSTISSRLRADVRLADVFRALFPCGSVTGAPKVATMRVIADLEDSPRGVYCGAVGYLAPPDAGGRRAVFNVAIRTVVLDEATGTAEYGVGGGITYDSSAAGEYDEVLAKSRVLTVRRPPFELFETLRYEPGSGFHHQEEHLDRLEGSARYFGFHVDRSAVEEALGKVAAEIDGDSRVKLLLGRHGELRAEVAHLPPAPPGPVRVALDTEPVDPSDVWLFHKTTLRETYDRRKRRRPDVDDVLLVNSRGEVTESTIANVAVELGGRWCTPPLDSGLLPGTYREELLHRGRLVERPIEVEELRAAERMALVSSVRGWRDAVLVP